MRHSVFFFYASKCQLRGYWAVSRTILCQPKWKLAFSSSKNWFNFICHSQDLMTSQPFADSRMDRRICAASPTVPPTKPKFARAIQLTRLLFWPKLRLYVIIAVQRGRQPRTVSVYSRYRGMLLPSQGTKFASMHSPPNCVRSLIRICNCSTSLRR